MRNLIKRFSGYLIGMLIGTIIIASISNFAYNIVNPDKTIMEVLLRTHKNFFWNFKDD